MTPQMYRAALGSDLVVHALSRDLERTVMVLSDGTTVSAGQLRNSISSIQQALEALSPHPLRAAVIARNRVEVPAIMTALGFAGIVATALHPMGAIDDYLYILEDGSFDVLIYDEEHYAGVAAELSARAPGLQHLLSIGAGGEGQSLMQLAQAHAPRPLVSPQVDPEDLARIAYSGGTTGKPKGIMVTHRGILTSALIQLTEWEWPQEIRHLICAPLSHAGSSVLTSLLVRNGSMVVLPGFDPVGVMQAIQQHRITSVLMVPTMVLALDRSSALRRIRSLQPGNHLLRGLGLSRRPAQGRDREAGTGVLPILWSGRSTDVANLAAPGGASGGRSCAAVVVRTTDAVDPGCAV